ncbi:ATP-binding protein [Streptomyces paludis]|nr:ATP-binding protein [Streptomyces paludis]
MAEADTTQYRQQLTVRPWILAGVRRIVGAYVRRWGFDPLVDDAVYCVQELLTNVVKHTESPNCLLVLQRCPSGIRVVVSDTSARLPVRREPDWGAESGRGLTYVENLADDWGAAPNETGGKDVWFEMRSDEDSAEKLAADRTVEHLLSR